MHPYYSSKPTRGRKRAETPTFKRAFTRRKGCLLQHDYLSKELPVLVIQTRFISMSADDMGLGCINSCIPRNSSTFYKPYMEDAHLLDLDGCLVAVDSNG